MRLASSSPRTESGLNTIKLIRDLVDFDAGNLHGSGSTYLHHSRMPVIWDEEFRADAHRIIYVVRSWNTPIAWFIEGEGWIYPPIGYTSYTSRQQNLVRHAIEKGHVPRTVPRRRHLWITIDWDWEQSA